MAFVFERFPSAEITAEIRAACAPSSVLVIAREPRAVAVLGFLKGWRRRAPDAPVLDFIGEDFLAGLLRDKLGL